MANADRLSYLWIISWITLGGSVVSGATFQAGRSDADNRNALTEQKLLAIPEQFNFDQDPIVDVIEFIREGAGVDLVLTDTAIEDSLRPDELMTINLKGLTYGKSLEILLRKHNACYTIDNGVVMIISRDSAGDPEHLRTKYFDCRLLIETIRTPTLSNPRNAEVKASETRSGDDAFNVRCNYILTTLQKLSEPDSWSDFGGTGEIVFVDGVLVVKQTEANLQKVENALVDMHSILGIKMPVRAILEKSSEVGKRESNQTVPQPTQNEANPFGNLRN